jgi:predicted nuclease of predicted toxin-antitoxin system
VRLLLDEMFPGALAEQLRARGHDVASIRDPEYVRLEGASDVDVFEAAVVETRIVVTEDVSGFRSLEIDALAEGRSTPGLIFTTDRQFPRGDPATFGRLVRALDALLGSEVDPPAVIFLRRPR